MYAVEVAIKAAARMGMPHIQVIGDNMAAARSAVENMGHGLEEESKQDPEANPTPPAVVWHPSTHAMGAVGGQPCRCTVPMEPVQMEDAHGLEGVHDGAYGCRLGPATVHRRSPI